jgi:hypothetical protein
MDVQEVIDYLLTAFAGVETSQNFGYDFFFYGSERMLPFVTIATTDNEYDSVSKLSRPGGAFRLNIGVSRETFVELVGTAKPDLSAYDFATVDTIMPHPEYAAQSWVCIVNPSRASFERIKPLLQEAYDLAVKRAIRRQGSAE